LGIEDVDVIGPGDAGETAGEIALLVAGEDEDGDHVGFMVSRWSERIVRRCGEGALWPICPVKTV
jgi:hypothetical protein